MGTVVRCIEEQISQPQAREMVFLPLDALGENDAVTRHAAVLCFFLNVVAGDFVGNRQPENAVLYPAEQSHPDIEDCCVIL